MFNRFFQSLKNDPMTAAGVGGTSSTVLTMATVAPLYFNNVILEDTSFYTARLILAAIVFTTFIMGAMAAILTQKCSKRCSAASAENTEHTPIANSFRV